MSERVIRIDSRLSLDRAADQIDLACQQAAIACDITPSSGNARQVNASKHVLGPGFGKNGANDLVVRSRVVGQLTPTASGCSFEGPVEPDVVMELTRYLFVIVAVVFAVVAIVGVLKAMSAVSFVVMVAAAVLLAGVAKLAAKCWRRSRTPSATRS